ncbi:MAG: NEW3 domain-containing protein [Candidatus Korobacteraceae bacterium]
MIESRKSKIALLLALLVAASLLSVGQEIPAQDGGISGLLQQFTKLKTTARLLHSTAHPDDDDGSMLAYESRGQGTSTLMLTLNRGEGGQNRIGSELFDELGVLRTLELLEAGRYYGNEQRFTRVVDFGFSKNSTETFEQWGGHDPALADMVRVIRTFRPDVIVSRFTGDSNDGHGNHQAAGILSREAFRAAADPKRFPEQIQQGLPPWQVKKLYIGNLRGREKDFTLRLDTGAYDPVLGMSYWQYSVEGLRHQASQGVGSWSAPPGPNLRGYRLEESVLPAATGQEKGFFDGIDTSIPGLAARLGAEEGKAPFLKPALVAIEQSVNSAMAAFDPRQPSRSAPALLDGLAQIREVMEKVRASALSPIAKADLLPHLETKEEQLEEAANLALGAQLSMSVDAAENRSSSQFNRQEQTFLFAVPGQTFTATARLFNRGGQNLVLQDMSLVLPEGWKSEQLKAEAKQLAANDSASVQFRITVPENAKYTRPYWQRKDASESVYKILDAQENTLALPPWPVRVRARYALAPLAATGKPSPGERRVGSIAAVAQVKFVDPVYGQAERPLAVAPPVSVEVDPPVQVVSTHGRSAVDLTVNVRQNVKDAASATVKLEAPPGWKAEPATEEVSFESENELKTLTFRLQPTAQLEEQRYELSASADYKGKTYNEGFETIGRKEVGYFFHYRPARQVVSAVDVNIVSRLRVGYIMGAGDDIPAVLRQVGIPVTILTPDQLATGDLSQFGTIVVGIRAYDVRSDIREQNRRLLDYVNRGGTLVVQYNQSTAQFNAGRYTPYPATASAERVTEEDAQVEILDPKHPVFTFPNPITAKDFQGWVQERGLYFMKEWDPRYVALTASKDGKEQPLKGGLLVASHGKGTYIYTGYAFFRQLPAGVPGAIRLFVNLLSVGHQQAATAARGASE